MNEQKSSMEKLLQGPDHLGPNQSTHMTHDQVLLTLLKNLAASHKK